MSNISIKVKELRAILGLSQTKFASDLDISRSAVAQIESGKTVPSFQIIYKMVSLYNIDASYFFDDNKKVDQIKRKFVQENVQPVTQTASSFNFSRHDLDVLSRIKTIYSIDDILPYVNNSSKKNNTLLKMYKEQLVDNIKSYNKLCYIGQKMNPDNDSYYASKFESIDVDGYLQGVYEDVDPKEWNEKLENKNILLILNILSFKSSIEHISFITNVTIDYLYKSFNFLNKN